MTSNPIEMAKTILSTTPARWLSLAEFLPLDLLARTPAPDEWSALECLYHLLDAENIFPVRVRAILAGQPIAAFDPDTKEQRTPIRLRSNWPRNLPACARPISRNWNM